MAKKYNMLIKYHTALVVLCTWVCGYFWDRSIPYFPIEVSRTGTGPVSSQVFRYGTLTIGATLWYEKHVDAFIKGHVLDSPVLVWLWVLLIAWFPDDTHNTVHVCAVLGMVMCIFLNVLLIGDTQRRMPIIVCAMAIQGAGIALKAFVVLFTELDRPMWQWRIYWDVLSNPLRSEVYTHVKRIMFESADNAIVPHLTLPLFRVTGVMQWLAFYLMMSLY